jgi:2-keto-4-pentenoate hydratase/2-oxohepta-3-ene-1,7-dioic acid hydratase in catechol pathway
VRLVTYRDLEEERLGVERDGRVAPAAYLVEGGPATIAELLSGDAGMLARLKVASEAPWPDRGAPLDDVTLLAPVPHPPKIVAVGLNYREHASEGSAQVPQAPLLFAKFPTAVVGPNTDIVWDPALTEGVDYEAELGVVIGKTARQITADVALDHVLGYTCLDDVSARDLQEADRQWVRAKSLDTFCPMGPALVTADEIADPQTLRVQAIVNGEIRQDASTADMIHSVAELVAFCSRFFTLQPGDIIATGTPSGIGWFREPRVVLHDGDEVVVQIERIGRLTNRCREERSA